MNRVKELMDGWMSTWRGGWTGYPIMNIDNSEHHLYNCLSMIVHECGLRYDKCMSGTCRQLQCIFYFHITYFTRQYS